MDEKELFALADRTLNGVVARISDDQWAMTMPVSFTRPGADAAPTLRQIINYHAYDDAWVPDMLAGRTMAEVGETFTGDVLGSDPKTAFAELVDTACAAATDLDDLDRTVHCSFGDFPAREYLWQVTMFRGLRSWDIAAVLGIDPLMSPELVQGLWDQIAPHAEEWRSYGVLPAAVPVPESAPLLDRLLGLTGRTPSLAS